MHRKDWQSPQPQADRAKTRRAASRRLILLGLLAPLLLTAAAAGQSAWPSPLPKFFRPGVSEPGTAPPHQARLRELAHLHPGLYPAGGRPASAFPLQTNHRKYLEAWPTPGTTTAEDWPKYVGESDQELD